MKKFFTLLLAVSFSLCIQAQGEVAFEHDTNVELGVQATDLEGISYNNVISTFSNIRILRWTSTVIEKTGGTDPTLGWQLAVCDRTQCFEPGIITKTFAAVTDSLNRMDVHMRPNGMDGYAIIEIVITDENNPDVEVSQLYYFNTEPPTSTIDTPEGVVTIYPNPAREFFTLSDAQGVGGIEVMSISGQMVRKFDFVQGETYDVTSLPQGAYLLRIMDRDGQLLGTERLHKI